MKPLRTIFFFLLVFSSLCTFAFEREDDGEETSFSSEINFIGKGDDLLGIKTMITQDNDTLDKARICYILLLGAGENNAIYQAVNSNKYSSTDKRQVTLILSNGEKITTDDGLAVGYVEEGDENGYYVLSGALSVVFKPAYFKSDRYATSHLGYYAAEKYFGQKLRDYNITKIIIDGQSFDITGSDTALLFDDVMDGWERERNNKFFTYPGKAPLPSGKTIASRRTSTTSTPSTMYGTVRYITPASRSSLSYLKENINKWEQCRTGAITTSRGIVIYDSNGYAYTSGFPNGFIDKLKEINKGKYRIEDVNVTANGYVIVFGSCGYSVRSGPNSFINKLKEYNKAEEHIISAVFNDSGRWAVVTDKNISWSDSVVGNFMKAAKERFGFINSIYISPMGSMIACCVNGVYYQNVPDNVIEKIKTLDYIPKVVKFTDDGLYLITDGESRYTYFM